MKGNNDKWCFSTCNWCSGEVICIPHSAPAKGHIPLAKIHKAIKLLQPDAANMLTITSSFSGTDVPRYRPKVTLLPPFGKQWKHISKRFAVRLVWHFECFYVSDIASSVTAPEKFRLQELCSFVVAVQPKPYFLSPADFLSLLAFPVAFPFPLSVSPLLPRGSLAHAALCLPQTWAPQSAAPERCSRQNPHALPFPIFHSLLLLFSSAPLHPSSPDAGSPSPPSLPHACPSSRCSAPSPHCSAIHHSQPRSSRQGRGEAWLPGEAGGGQGGQLSPPLLRTEKSSQNADPSGTETSRLLPAILFIHLLI